MQVDLSSVDSLFAKHPFSFSLLLKGPTTGQLPLLIESLQNLINLKYPYFNGELLKGNENGQKSLLMSAVGVSITSQKLNSKIEEFKVTNIDYSLDSVLPSPWPKANQELVALKISEFLNGFLLAARFPHALVDAQGATLFWSNWGRSFSHQPLVDPVWDSSIFTVDSTSTPLFNHSKEFSFSNGEAWNSGLEPPNLTDRIFHFSKHQLESLKEDYNKDKTGEYISTNDCLSALFLHEIGLARGTLTDINFTTIVNCRSKLSPPLDASFSQNGILPMTSRHSLNNKPGQTASIIRSSLLKMNHFYIKSMVSYIQSHNLDLLDIPNGAFLGSDLVCTSWSDLGMKDISFGPQFELTYAGPLMGSTVDGLMFILDDPAAIDAGGKQVLVCLEVKTMENLLKNSQCWLIQPRMDPSDVKVIT
jgi:hypothetical protein